MLRRAGQAAGRGAAVAAAGVGGSCSTLHGASQVTRAQRVRDTRGWPRTGAGTASPAGAASAAGSAGTTTCVAETGSAARAAASRIASRFTLPSDHAELAILPKRRGEQRFTLIAARERWRARQDSNLLPQD